MLLLSNMVREVVNFKSWKPMICTGKDMLNLNLDHVDPFGLCSCFYLLGQTVNSSHEIFCFSSFGWSAIGIGSLVMMGC